MHVYTNTKLVASFTYVQSVIGHAKRLIAKIVFLHFGSVTNSLSNVDNH